MTTVRAKPAGAKRVWVARVAWLVGIWACSVAALALVAWLMKVFFRSVGLG